MTTEAFSPIKTKDRIVVIDILRGIALLGIILVNVHGTSNSGYVTEVSGSGLDRLVQFMTDTFFLNKFYTLFSFLFGLGMSLQMARAEQKGVPFVKLYLRRLFWLLVFGLIHAIFIWDGDILIGYAVIGAFSLLFRKLSPKALLTLAIIFLVAYNAVASLGLDFGGEVSDTAEHLTYQDERQQEIDLFREGSYAELTRYRFNMLFEVDAYWEIILAPFGIVIDGADILGLFLLGLACGKLGLFQEIEIHLALWKRIFCWAFPIGLLINISGGLLAYFSNTDASWYYGSGMWLVQVGAVPMTLGYISGIVLLSRKTRWLALFAPAGKMALTVYLSQSIILILIFYSYGLGLFSTIGMAAAALLALTIFFLQILFCNLWMRRFRFGPFEWLWRSLTYRKFQLLRIPSRTYYETVP